ncbi:MAG: hypothetical protein ABI566_04555 [Pseudolysinimonas sp.]
MKTLTRPRVLPQPSISGPKMIEAGGVSYGVPQSAGVAVVEGSQLVYVLYRARLHLFGQPGEIEIPSAIRARLASHYFGARRP